MATYKENLSNGQELHDHFLYSHYHEVQLRGDTLGRNWMLIILKGSRVDVNFKIICLYS